jgi:ABC-type Zn uptake system ZnuABC Zn-binding protein ZnuA
MILDKRLVVSLLLPTFVLASCGHNHAPSAASLHVKPVAAATKGLPVVVATTSTVGALVKSVAGDNADVEVLVPIGASPETYEPTPRDVVALSHAGLIVQNGAGLEVWLAKLIASSSSNAPVVTLSDAIPAGRSATADGAAGLSNAPSVNPHFWLDPAYAELYVGEIAHALAAVDPANASRYRANAAEEIKRLADLDSWTRGRIASIPVEGRVMIAFHDAWYYFDKRYGIRDVGSIETSPGKEPSAAELAALIATAKADHVRAVFAEPEFSPKLAKQLAEGAGITTVTDLYDDSLGNTPELSSYEGMMHHNVDTIVKALGS